ncbi:hypothetical protein METSCH_A01500 [Metschnikowia aff. pulcherrima]|uniref:Secreted protein n=1 Tax=Metschnikowia aff. pulcherrima TaxID=2163413 RepID=A0A4P6XFU5_9ASCO|nr:hypothetical protein METSCH_A01500 [Metschnikowia aff. pulcherrima]
MLVWVELFAHGVNFLNSVLLQCLLENVSCHRNTIEQVSHFGVCVQSLLLDRVKSQGEVVHRLQQILGEFLQGKVFGLLVLFFRGFLQVSEVGHRSRVVVLHLGQGLVLLQQFLAQLNNNRVFLCLSRLFCGFLLFCTFLRLDLFSFGGVPSHTKVLRKSGGNGGRSCYHSASKSTAHSSSGERVIKRSLH